jgi:hypothetical protein
MFLEPSEQVMTPLPNQEVYNHKQINKTTPRTTIAEDDKFTALKVAISSRV